MKRQYRWCIACMAFFLFGMQSQFAQANSRVWQRVEIFPGISVLAPASMKLVDPKGPTDAQLRYLEGDGLRLEFERSPYANDFKLPPGGNQPRFETIQVGGYSGKLLRIYAPDQYADAPYIFALSFSNIATSPVGNIRLSIFCQLKNKQKFGVVERIYRSIIVP